MILEGLNAEYNNFCWSSYAIILSSKCIFSEGCYIINIMKVEQIFLQPCSKKRLLRRQVYWQVKV